MADPILPPGGEFTPPGRTDVMLAELDARIAAARNLTFDQETERYFKSGSSLKSDTFTARVRFVDGTEEYDAIRRGNKTYRNLQQLGGPYVMGELSTILTVTRDAIQRGNVSVTEGEDSNHEPTVAAHFHVNASRMGWLLAMEAAIHPLDFDGTAEFSAETGRLVKISWRAVNPTLPAYYGIEMMSWTASFSPALIGGASITVPVKSSYRVDYRRAIHRTEWTESTFSNYRRFGTTTELSFAADEDGK